MESRRPTPDQIEDPLPSLTNAEIAAFCIAKMVDNATEYLEERYGEVRNCTPEVSSDLNQE